MAKLSREKIVTILLCLLLLLGQNDVLKLGCDVLLVDVNTTFFLSSDSGQRFPDELSPKLRLSGQRRQNVQS